MPIPSRSWHKVAAVGWQSSLCSHKPVWRKLVPNTKNGIGKPSERRQLKHSS